VLFVRSRGADHGAEFSHTIKRFGWECKFVDFDDLDAVKAAIDGDTRAVFGEAIANPGGYIMDVRAIADIADEAGVPLIIDNTTATPFLCRRRWSCIPPPNT